MKYLRVGLNDFFFVDYFSSFHWLQILVKILFIIISCVQKNKHERIFLLFSRRAPFFFPAQEHLKHKIFIDFLLFPPFFFLSFCSILRYYTVRRYHVCWYYFCSFLLIKWCKRKYENPAITVFNTVFVYCFSYDMRFYRFEIQL